MFIDPTGMEGESIHLGKYGNILKNVDDGDNGVYLHKNAKTERDINKTYSSKNTSAGGEKIGELGGTIDANYIYSNTLSKNTEESSNIWNPNTFREYVKGGGKWDLKVNKETIYGLANDGKTKFTFEGKIMESQDIGNHHFGAVGKAYGFFSETFMLEQAGKAQMQSGTSRPEWQKYKTSNETIPLEHGMRVTVPSREMLPPYGDDPRDQKWIKSGFQYYKNHK